MAGPEAKQQDEEDQDKCRLLWYTKSLQRRARLSCSGHNDDGRCLGQRELILEEHLLGAVFVVVRCAKDAKRETSETKKDRRLINASLFEIQNSKRFEIFFYK